MPPTHKQTMATQVNNVGESMEIENENDKEILIKDFTENLNELDTVPLYLTPKEREVLILFLNEVSKLSAVYVERVIQTAYLFNIADIAFDLNGSPYLTGFIEAFKQYKAPKSKKELFEAIGRLEKYLLPEGKVGAEAKRQKLITEVNRLVPKAYAVPSHRSFGITLQFLNERGYIIIAEKHNSKTLWSIDPDLYAKWSVRRHQLFEERTQKIKEFQNANTPEEAELNANEYMINKYSIIVLDFYNITYVPYRVDNVEPDIKVISINPKEPGAKVEFKESLYLRYRKDIDLFLP